MKKLIVSIELIIIMIVEFVLLTGCSGNNREYEKYYKITYLSTYSSSYILNENKYEIITDEKRLNEIYDKISYKENEVVFDKNYFENKNLLAIERKLDSEINKMKIDNDKVNITIYSASPLVSVDEELNFDLYLIPIEKTVTQVDIDSTVYPGVYY